MEINTETYKKPVGNPVVSVCVQTYQHVNYIKLCLDGILSQKTDFPFELIIGEDESTDGTREICKEYAEKYPDIIRLFLRSRKDVITIEGRVTGRYNFIQNLRTCRGEFIALCEGDDYWTDPMKLQKQVDFLRTHPDYTVCFHKVKILKDDQLIDDYITIVPAQSTTYVELADGNYIHTPSVMFRAGAEIPDWFDKILAGDYALHMLNAVRGKLYCLDDIMAVYRVHPGGIWSTNDEDQNQIKWMKGLTILSSKIEGNAAKLLRKQRLKWAIVLFKKGYTEEVEKVFCDSIPDIIEEQDGLKNTISELKANPDFINNNVSGRTLIKALMKKIIK